MPNSPILIVRPLREEDAFLALLNQASVAFKYIPIMEIQPVTEVSTDYPDALETIDRLAQFDQAIFISANAAEVGLSMISARWPTLPENIEFLAVGQQTAEVFNSFDYPVQCPEGKPNTEGLLEELPQLQNLASKSVVIFRGGQGRQTLGEELERRGGTVKYCELYRRDIQQQRLAEAKSFVANAGCLVVHSGELLQAMGNPVDKHIPLVVPSDRIAKSAHKMGYQTIQVAKNALPTSMFEAVMQAVSTEHK